MHIKGFRLYVVIIAVIATLAILLTIQFINQKYNVEQPLFKLYSQTKIVKDAKIEDKGDTVKVIIKVKKTENLKQAYNELTEYTNQIMDGKRYEMQIKDNRSAILEKAYYNSQFVIYEALAKGDFTKMANVIEKYSQKVGAESLVFIDDKNIYVEFLKGDNYLYEVIPRQSNSQSKDGADKMGSEKV